MTILNDSYPFWNLLIPIEWYEMKQQCRVTRLLFLSLLFLPSIAHPQFSKTSNPVNGAKETAPVSFDLQSGRSVVNLNYRQNDNSGVSPDTVPKPSRVLFKSMIIPGWGQVVNRQVWKVPIIYGMLGGLTYYSILMNRNYQDYRAAYYNLQYPDEDPRFGPTPDYIPPDQNLESLRFSRNAYRNRRDLTFIGIALAYGLNIVDAYVFAHMRDFDVSDDLSANIQVGPFANLDFSNHNSELPVLLKSVEDSYFGNVTVTIHLRIP